MFLPQLGEHNCAQPVRVLERASLLGFGGSFLRTCSDQHLGLADLPGGLFSVHVHLLLRPALPILAVLASLTSSLILLSSVRLSCLLVFSHAALLPENCLQAVSRVIMGIIPSVSLLQGS